MMEKKPLNADMALGRKVKESHGLGPARKEKKRKVQLPKSKLISTPVHPPHPNAILVRYYS